jgi:hypothetical protein
VTGKDVVRKRAPQVFRFPKSMAGKKLDIGFTLLALYCE